MFQRHQKAQTISDFPSTMKGLEGGGEKGRGADGAITPICIMLGVLTFLSPKVCHSSKRLRYNNIGGPLNWVRAIG